VIEPILHIKNLEVEFQTEEGCLRAVNNVSLELNHRRTLGLVGESGCGKSVTALSVMRLIPNPPGKIAGGSILWKGRDILKIPAAQMPAIRGREISMIFQEPMTSLNPVFTIERQISEVLQLRFNLKGAKARKRIIESLSSVGIPDPENRLNAYPHELSGGMMQRIMIAMALLCEPDLLIADEPTTALDVTVQAQIIRLIKDLQTKMGMAVLFITHDMGLVAETCDDVAVMYAGEVVEQSDVVSLFTKPLHPYTFGLMQSIPKRGASRETPLFTIEGTVPPIFKMPAGCAFASRCFRRRALAQEEQQRCVNEKPLLTQIPESSHFVSCHFPLEVQCEQSHS